MQLVRHKGRAASQIVEGDLPAPISLRILLSRTTALVIIETEVSDCSLDLVRDCIGQVITQGKFVLIVGVESRGSSTR